MTNQIAFVRSLRVERNLFSTFFYYDRLGRIVASQNSRQHEENKYSYTLYDALGRVYEAGEKLENPYGNPQFKSIFGAYVGGSYIPSVVNDSCLSVWLNDHATETRFEVTKSYYDVTNLAISPELPSNFNPDPLTQRKRIVHVTYEQVYDGLDNVYDHATHYDYDIHGNVKTLLQDNRKLLADQNVAPHRFKRLDYLYDLVSGNVHRVDYETGKLDQWHHAYEYDADNRITDVFTSTETPITSINSSIASIQNEPVINPLWEQEAAYIYYDHGSLARTELGENKVQGLDYVYTLQGWIKSVNSNNLKNDPGNDGSPGQNNVTAKDAFGYSLHYFDNDYHSAINGQNSFITSQANSDMELNNSPLYNGNIARMVTTITNPTTREVLPLGNVYQYDQLNRLSNAQSYAMNSSTFTWSNGATPMYKNSFTYDANGNILTQNRANGANTVLDDLTYHYETFPNGDPRNRLAYVSDASSNTDPLELSNQSAANYSYDKEGRLISDAQEEIGVISWRVDGKVKKISRISGSQKKNVSFDYDAMGHRIAKHVYSSNDIWENSTFYVLDAQGNTLSTYSYEKDDSTQSISFAQTEKLCYGSARLGLNNEKVPLLASQNGNYSMQYVSHTVGNRLYELSNHLGNVLSVVSDKVIPFPNQNMTPGSYFLFFIPDIRQSTDYSPFGVTLQGRNFTANGTEKLRYAFNGMEKDDEVKGAGNSYDFGARLYDSRL